MGARLFHGRVWYFMGEDAPSRTFVGIHGNAMALHVIAVGFWWNRLP